MANPHLSIDVKTQFLGEVVVKDEINFQFAYEIKIRNQSEVQVQLLSRHWWITDQFNKTIEVVGDGVVGKQPVIEPNQSFTYISGSSLSTPFGFMHGTYTMQSEMGDKFDVEIPQFVLASKKHLH